MTTPVPKKDEGPQHYFENGMLRPPKIDLEELATTPPYQLGEQPRYGSKIINDKGFPIPQDPHESSSMNHQKCNQQKTLHKNEKKGEVEPDTHHV